MGSQEKVDFRVAELESALDTVLEYCSQLLGSDFKENETMQYAVKVLGRSQSLGDACEIAGEKESFKLAYPDVDKVYSGKVMGVTDCHVVLSLGRTALIVAQSDMDRVPAQNEEVSVTFKDGRGRVQPGKEPCKSKGR